MHYFTVKRVLSTIGWKNKLYEEEVKAISKVASTEPIDYLVKILTSKVYDVAIETPLTYAANLSNLLGNSVYLKREDLQPVFSFKIRGAYNKISHLSLEQRQRGVVTCSAGNHAQGVAMSAARLGIKATIVMPEATPKIKVNAVSRFGGEMTTIVLHGKNYDEAASEAHRLVKLNDSTLVHPFDDPLVIAGQGTIGMEILKVIFSLNIFHILYHSYVASYLRDSKVKKLIRYLYALVVEDCWPGWLHMSKQSNQM